MLFIPYAIDPPREEIPRVDHVVLHGDECAIPRVGVFVVHELEEALLGTQSVHQLLASGIVLDILAQIMSGDRQHRGIRACCQRLGQHPTPVTDYRESA
jgi:hypothetical protein